MMLAIFGGSFLDNAHGQFDPINYLFGSGIATNIGASLIWGSAAAVVTVVIIKKVKAEWAKHRAHQEWQAKQQAALHAHVGLSIDAHPDFDR